MAARQERLLDGERRSTCSPRTTTRRFAARQAFVGARTCESWRRRRTAPDEGSPEVTGTRPTRHPLTSCADPPWAWPLPPNRGAGVWYASSRSKAHGRSSFVTSLMTESIHSRCVAALVGYRSTFTSSTSPTRRHDRISAWMKQTLCPTTVPPPDHRRAARDAGFDAVLAPAARYPAAKRSRCSFRRCPTSRPSGRRFASPSTAG